MFFLSKTSLAQYKFCVMWHCLNATCYFYKDAGCIWCESTGSGDVPWCFFNTTNLGEGIADSERVNCIPEGGFSPVTCEERGCQIASTNTAGAPMCYFKVGAAR